MPHFSFSEVVPNLQEIYLDFIIKNTGFIFAVEIFDFSVFAYNFYSFNIYIVVKFGTEKLKNARRN